VNLLGKFAKLFKKDETGLRNREWRDMSEDKIRDHWNACRTLLEAMIYTEFKYIKIPKSSLTQALSKDESL
jgi:hypothetical protein